MGRLDGRELGKQGALHGGVLVAVGNRDLRDGIIAGLTQAGIVAAEAATHKIALAKLWADPSIDVILVDPGLPGGGGTRLVDTARAALGRFTEAVILAQTGAFPCYLTVDPRDVGHVTRSTAECLRHVASRRGSGADSRVGPAPGDGAA